MNLWAHAINATLQLNRNKIQSHFVCGSHWNISINFSAYLTIVSPHTIHPKNPWQCNPPPPPPPPHPPSQERKDRKPKGELIMLPDVISQDYSNDKTDPSSSIKNTFHRLTTTKISKIKNLCFQQYPTFCKCQTLCSLCRGILTSFRFLVFQSSNQAKQTLKGPIIHLEE